MNNLNINKIEIRPITNEEEYKRAGEIIDSLIDADQIENPKERKRALDILEAISILACAYEKKHYPIPRPDPITAIKERMNQLNLNQKDVAPYFGSESRVSEVLSRKRSMSLSMIRQLSKYLNIPTDILIGA